MMASLTGMDVSNASLYDGASALAEAVLMAVRTHKKGHKILMPRSVHPVWRKVVHAIVKNQKIELIEVDYDRQGGHATIAALDKAVTDDCAALVIPQPNFFGVLEDVDTLTDWAHAKGLLALACCNPTPPPFPNAPPAAPARLPTPAPPRPCCPRPRLSICRCLDPRGWSAWPRSVTPTPTNW